MTVTATHENVRRKLTTAEAVEWVRKAPRGTKFCVRVRINAPIVDSEGEYVGGVLGYVRLPGREILQLLRSGISADLEAKGARWPASRQNYTLLDKKYVVYWIG